MPHHNQGKNRRCQEINNLVMVKSFHPGKPANCDPERRLFLTNVVAARLQETTVTCVNLRKYSDETAITFCEGGMSRRADAAMSRHTDYYSGLEFSRLLRTQAGIPPI